MKFKSKKLREYQFEEHLSDPGSKDSWEELYKKDDERKLDSVADTVAELPQNVSAQQSLEPTISNGANLNHKQPLLVTSTPHVNFSRLPLFEVSSIISPVEKDETFNEDSRSILTVNRKNQLRSADQAFNNLINPGNKDLNSSCRAVSGIKAFKEGIDRVDTTRQYGGGIFKSKSHRRSNLSVVSSEDDWFTTEEQTATVAQKSSTNSEKSKKRNESSTLMLQKEEKDGHTMTARNSNPATKVSIQSDDGRPLNIVNANSTSAQIKECVKEKVLKTIDCVDDATFRNSCVDNSFDMSKTLCSKLHSSNVKESSQFPTKLAPTNSHIQTLENHGKKEESHTVLNNRREQLMSANKCKMHTDKSDKINPSSNCQKGSCGSRNELSSTTEMFLSSPRIQCTETGESECLVLNKVDDQICRKDKKQEETTKCPSNTGNMIVCNSAFVMKIGSSVLKQSSQFEFGFKERGASEMDSTNLHNKLYNKSNDLPNAIIEPAGTEQASDHENTQYFNPDLASTSEEEKKLLLAQSLELRKNKSQSCINVKSPKAAMCKLAFQKSFEKFLQSEPGDVHQDIESSKINEGENLMLVPTSCNKSSVCYSSEEHQVLLSRNPEDCCASNDSEINLEIVLSSEEEDNFSYRFNLKNRAQSKEVQKNKRRLTQRDNITEKTNQKKKGGNLSFKARETRRRREEKIRNLMKSSKESSDSDSELSQPPTKKDTGRSKHSNRRTMKINSNSVEKVVNRNISEAEIKPNTENFGLKLSNTIGNLIASPGSGEKITESPTKEIVQLQKMNTRSLGQQASTSDINSSQAKQKTLTQETNKERVIISSCEASEENFHPASRDSCILNTCELSQSIHQALAPTKRGLKRTGNKDFDTGPIKASRKIEERLGEKDLPSADFGIRHSGRTRKPPSVYWIASKALHSTYENKYVDLVGKSLARSHQEHHGKCSNTQTDRNKKTTIQKNRVIVSLSQGTEHAKKIPKSTNIGTSSNSSDEKEVLYHEGNVESLFQTCNKFEVKESECVSGSGMKGDTLVLGLQATYDRRSTDTSKVFYILDGNISYQSGQEKRIFGPGSFLVVPKGKKFILKNSGDSNGKLLVVSSKA